MRVSFVVLIFFVVSVALAAPARRQPEETVLIKIHNPFGNLGSGNFLEVHRSLNEVSMDRRIRTYMYEPERAHTARNL